MHPPTEHHYASCKWKSCSEEIVDRVEHVGDENTGHRHFVVDLVQLIEITVAVSCPMNHIEQKVLGHHAQQKLLNYLL